MAASHGCFNADCFAEIIGRKTDTSRRFSIEMALSTALCCIFCGFGKHLYSIESHVGQTSLLTIPTSGDVALILLAKT